MGPNPCMTPMLPGFWLCEGVDCPSLTRTSVLVFISFLVINYAKWGGKGKVRREKQSGGLRTVIAGDCACKDGAIPVPLHPVPMLSHGVLEKKKAG